MDAITVHSDFVAQENKICHRLHFIPIYLPWSDGTGGHILVFGMLNVEFQASFFIFLFHSHQEVLKFVYFIYFVHINSVTQSCSTLCDPMDCSMPGFPVHHQPPGLAQSHAHRQWCHPTILSSAILFSCLQSFPAARFFPMGQFFTLGGQRIGVSAWASVFPMNIQDWFLLGLSGWISLQSKGALKNLLQHYSSKASIICCSAFFIVQLSYHTWSLEKP